MDSINEWFQPLAEQISVRPSVGLAALGSIVLVAWGNFVVVRSVWLLRRRGKRVSELFTLFAHGGAAVVVLAVSLWIGFSARDLGLRPPRFDRPHWSVVSVFVFVAVVVVAFSLVGLARHRNKANGVWKLELVRLLVGTAGGEEFLFRGFLLALWAGTGASSFVVIISNVLPFGLWHVAGARKEGRFHWGDVIGPSAFAAVCVSTRIAFDSLLAPWLLHAAINLPGLALDLKRTPRSGEARDTALNPAAERSAVKDGG